MIGRESEFTVKATTDGKNIKLSWRLHNVSKKATSSFDRVEMTLKVSDVMVMVMVCIPAEATLSGLLFIPQISLARIFLKESSWHIRSELILNFSRHTDGTIVLIKIYEILNVWTHGSCIF